MLDITLTDDDRNALTTALEFLRERARYYRTTTSKERTARQFDKCADAVGRVLNAKEVTK